MEIVIATHLLLYYIYENIYIYIIIDMGIWLVSPQGRRGSVTGTTTGMMEGG